MATNEAVTLREGRIEPYTPTVAKVAGEVVQLPDGRAGQCVDAIAAAALGHAQVDGVCTVLKTASMVILKGSKVYWDHSASKASLLFGADTRDFYLGVAVATAASAGTTVQVALNREPCYTLSLADGYHSVPVDTAGQTQIVGHKNGVSFIFTTTVEAQKQDALSIRGINKDTPGILSALVCINLNGDDAAFDFNVGLANATHATDADSITESLFAHIDGASLNIMAESDDGTAEVTTVDTTVDAVVGTPFLVQWDLTDNTDIQMYIDGVNVLPSTEFKLDSATGPLKLLAHMEKTSNDSPGNFTIMDLGFTSFDV